LGILAGDARPLNLPGEDALNLSHRAVNIRWLAATVVLACIAAGLLFGALRSATGRKLRWANAPVLVVPSLTHQEVVEAGRSDRVAAVGPAKSKPTPVRIEQLDDSGSGTRRYTHLFARLDELEQEALDAEATSQTDQDRGAGITDDKPPSPPKLRQVSFAKHRPALPKEAKAYAALEQEAKTALIFEQPLNLSVVPWSSKQSESLVRVIVARAGDSLPAILEALGDPANDAEAVAAAASGQGGLGATFAGGEVIKVLEDGESDHAAPAPVLEVTIEPPGRPPIVLARTDRGGYALVEASDNADKSADASAAAEAGETVQSGETLRDSLDALAAVNHLDAAVVDELVRLCGHDFDLDSSVSGSDTVDVLYSPDERGRPELDFVALSVGGKSHRYYRFAAPDDGSTDFYDENGNSITQFLLRKPVAAGRLGDGFGWRVHPILKDRRFHEGVDYAAPYGSPIVAAGAGVVEIIGQQWGYGKYIRIKHDLGYETTYAHIAGVPRGLKVGDRVRQGETIAYIGSTGLSTGPHLYYEVRINGHNVNPLRIKLAGGRVLKGDVLDSFTKARQRLDELIDASAVASASH
jgi:murein DD-endopeptidase MepM/ murein hydrolase activator NlpD